VSRLELLRNAKAQLAQSTHGGVIIDFRDTFGNNSFVSRHKPSRMARNYQVMRSEID